MPKLTNRIQKPFLLSIIGNNRNSKKLFRCIMAFKFLID